MKTVVIKYNNRVSLPDGICAAIGNFDGVHLGHQELINECKRHGSKSAVITFSPHPSVFLKKMPNYPLITPMEKKTEIFEGLGIDYFIIIEFNELIAATTKEKFISMLHDMNIKSLVCGYDFTFGRRGEGTAMDLRDEFELYVIPKYVIDEVRVSSTYIRELLGIGDVSLANRMLGRVFSVKGEVIYGSQKGRVIGFPTANLDYKNYYLPLNGVYAVYVAIGDRRLLGMCNIGHNPTFNFAANRRLEVNIFDFNEDIYGEVIEIFFIKRIRDEKKFKTVNELLEQMNSDKLRCKEIAKGYLA